MNDDERAALLSVIQTLMVADNFGDVHEAVIALHQVAELPEPEGNYLDGWTKEDYARVGFDRL